MGTFCCVLFLVFTYHRALCWSSTGTVIVVFVFVRAGDNGAAAMLVFGCGVDCWDGDQYGGVSRRYPKQQWQMRWCMWREGADGGTLKRGREGRTCGQKELWLRLTVSWNDMGKDRGAPNGR